VLTYAMFPQVAPKFFESRSQGRKNLGKDPVKASPATPMVETAAGDGLKSKVSYVITLNGKEHRVTVAPQK
jgi:methylmalonyl-CoA carboxyltransferase 5S subunit